MPFRLFNAESIFQMMVNKLFKNMMGMNMEAYIDDMFVKSTKSELHMTDLPKASECICLHKASPEPHKWIIGVNFKKY